MSGSYNKDLKALAEASWKDCLPIQFGLSKVMCDLFCIDDAVRSGTSAVLESLEDSHNVLMTNIQALLDYQTQYLLGAIGTVLNPQTREDSQEHEILSASAVLQELREFPKHNAQNDDLTLNRDVLDWHRATGDELISRITAMSINASTASWPHRVRSLKGMLYHYRNSLHERLNGPMPSVASVAQRQIKDKLQLLSDLALLAFQLVHDSMGPMSALPSAAYKLFQFRVLVFIFLFTVLPFGSARRRAPETVHTARHQAQGSEKGGQTRAGCSQHVSTGRSTGDSCPR